VASTVREALEIDEKMGATHWKEAIEKEMKNILIPGYKSIDCHMVFDIKMMGIVSKC
jgi:uncharacterized protein with HEPN domain